MGGWAVCVGEDDEAIFFLSTEIDFRPIESNEVHKAAWAERGSATGEEWTVSVFETQIRAEVLMWEKENYNTHTPNKAVSTVSHRNQNALVHSTFTDVCWVFLFSFICRCICTSWHRLAAALGSEVTLKGTWESIMRDRHITQGWNSSKYLPLTLSRFMDTHHESVTFSKGPFYKRVLQIQKIQALF